MTSNVTTRVVTAAALLGFASLALAQSATDSGVGAGQGARDGSRPSDGAIVGGTLREGETAGAPTNVPGIMGGSSVPADRGNKRCNELSGTLRQQCLLQEQNSSTGGTAAPEDGRARPADARMETPPQNPR